MQTTYGNNENVPIITPSRLSPLQIPKHEPLSPQNSTQGDLSFLPPPLPPPWQSQNSIHEHPSSSSSQNLTNVSHSSIPTTTTTKIISNSESPSLQKSPLCGPPSPARFSSSSLTRMSWPLMPPPPYNHQSSMIPYYPPMGMPPPFPYFSMPFPHDQFHHPMIPQNNNASNGQIYSQPWSTGLFDCFSDPKNCFITCLCPCITFGQVDEILSEGQMTWWEGALMFGLLESLCCQASLIFAWYHRV